VNAVCQRAAEILEAFPEVVAAYVFGSFGRGEGAATSDVDVAVLSTGSAVDGLSSPLRRALERGLGREVDLVDLRAAPVDLVHRVLRDGDLVVERDRAARVAFEVRRRNEYFDLLPVLRRYRAPRTS
jgi:hypothetical protein